ncbi:beta-ketoacyl-ACP synthase 3 [Nitrospiraceae bacterium AH_259_D15_M11_P09]|nr:beta-ketoacyl-ACP synthase 3 [Nitrospiraceae bacterium AH_259_D15_M11_P09]
MADRSAAGRTVQRSKIVGTGAFLPVRVVGNGEVSRRLRLDAEAVYRRTGIRTRHWAAEEEAASDLAERAARRALDAAGLGPASVDAIVVSTTSPDTVLPSTACHLQWKLGAQSAAAFDVAASCSGFLYGLSMADRLISSHQFRCCLVVAAEVKSRFLDLEDESTAILFGDGAGAAVVVGDNGRSAASDGILGVRLYADGARHGLITLLAGGSRQPASLETVLARKHAIRIQGMPLFRVAVKRLAEAVTGILKEFGVRLDELDQVVFHQANGRLLTSLRERLGIPSHKMYAVIERFGNTSSASLPIALDHAVRERHIQAGNLVLLGTFGGGLTWATALVRWS